MPPPFAGAIFLQSIPTNRSLHDDAPSISEGWGGKVSDYRIMVSTSYIAILRGEIKFVKFCAYKFRRNWLIIHF